MKKLIKISPVFLLPFLLIALIAWYFIFQWNSESGSKKYIKKNIELRTSWVQISEDFNTLNLFWKLVSNEVADIYPRRQWIIKDIFVDIWDEVKEWQVLAMLLPPWVEWQSSASISEKRVKLKLAEDEYSNALKISTESINLSENLLKTITNNENAWIEVGKQSIKTSEVNLQSARDNLDKAISEKGVKLKDLENNLSQKIEQSEAQIAEIKQEIFNAISGDWYTDNYEDISSKDVPSNFWTSKTWTVQNVLNDFRILIKTESEYFENKESVLKSESTLDLINKAINLVKSTEEMLKSSSTSSSFSKDDLNTEITNTTTFRASLLSLKENIEDSVNWIQTFLSSEDKKITELTNQVKKQEELVKQSEDSFYAVQTSEEKNISTAEKNLSLTKAQEKQRIEKAKNSLDSARAELQAELAKSWHTRVNSPFSWVISKRMINVWEVININNPIFELNWVSTSLSQKAKNEIVFWLPEKYFDLLIPWDEISFFAINNESEIFKANVTRKSSQIDWTSHNVEVRAKTSDEINLPHHTSIRVKIKTTKNDIFKIWKNAVKKEWNENFVWIKNWELVEKISVDVVSDDWEFADIQNPVLTWTSSLIIDSDSKIQRYLKSINESKDDK